MKIAAVAVAALFLAMPAQADESWGWELPDYGKPVKIVAIFRSPEGHIVAWYSSGEKGGGLVSGLYDTTTRKELATRYEMASVGNYETEQALLKTKHLTDIPFQYREKDYQGAHIQLEDLSGPHCTFPYDEAFSISPSGGEQKLYLVIWKRPKPAVGSDDGCTYSDAPSPRLRTRYQAQEWDFHWTTGTDKYLVMGDVPWIVRFDERGETHFFDHRDDAGLVRAEQIKPLIEAMEDASPRKAQLLVDEAEKIISQQLQKAR